MQAHVDDAPIPAIVVEHEELPGATGGMRRLVASSESDVRTKTMSRCIKVSAVSSWIQPTSCAPCSFSPRWWKRQVEKE